MDQSDDGEGDYDDEEEEEGEEEDEEGEGEESERSCTTDSEEEAYIRETGGNAMEEDYSRRSDALWTIDSANKDPYHFLKFLTPAG